MQLYEKLSFLMNLTNTKNRTLAQEIHVDPSLISRLRTGKRGEPRNPSHTKAMSKFFARQCTTKYQRQALAEMIGAKQSLTMKQEQLSDILYYWLRDDADKVSRFMHTFESLEIKEMDPDTIMDSQSLNSGSTIYHGNAGKRAAVRTVYQHLLSLERPKTIFIFADETDDWIIEDSQFAARLQDWALKLAKHGFRFCHIAPPVSSADQALDDLIRWIPIYMTGQVDAFFYPRIRDNVHRRTLMVVPGIVAIASNSTAGRSSSYATILTTDQRLTHAYNTEFHDYLSLCRPMLNIYHSTDKLLQCFTEFLIPDGSRIQKLVSLSSESAPPELIASLLKQRKQPALKKLGRLYLQEMEHIEENRNKTELIDICCMASAEQVRAGIVPILSTCRDSEILYYDAESYILHLKNILRIMETCSNYHFIPVSGKFEKDSTLMVKENHRALLVHLSDPFTVLEISQPDIVVLYREYLFRLAEKTGYTGIHRRKIMSELRRLIEELRS